LSGKRQGKLLTKSQFARQIGVKPAYISKLLKRGTIKSRNGRIDPAEALKSIRTNRNPARQSKVVRQEELEGGEAGSTGYLKVKTANEYYRAKMAELVWRKRSGELLDAKKVRGEMFSLGRTVRDQMLNIPGRLAPVLAPSPEKIEEYRRKIEEYIREGLETAGIIIEQS
jgi:phage terminase Nu1 subunit (DNA packaging protein)